MPTPLTSECDDCRGCGLRTHDHPNDPWARTFQCETCEGTGEVVAECECCSRDAVTVFEGLMLCATCAREQMEDAVETAEYRAETVR